ncbi:sulfatase-like hydrolase/transferase [Maribacter sp. HTCC2170]|uniref:sulfatase-like hydrolase/transferase n=1 Tax=Maribacter sp. (strain HTCC2170 / KCCM 42371) TaxID=313603 RepID=UPI00006BD51F|nr:sulfatase-like hydrolase/transferase [Maribacter sp. HTCC2170]EAR02039.1 putative secreted sulfatase ydeN precursor [Maribacter sp. HTCC2170]
MIKTRLLLLLVLFFGITSCEPEQIPEPKPNIVLFFVDDMGWQDTSVPFWYKKTPFNEVYKTPNMERLAADGVKFTQAYSTAVCSPTRVSLMTGMNAARHRVTNWTLRKDSIQPMEKNHPILEFPLWNVNGMSPVAGDPKAVHATPLPQLLNDAGYFTVHSGKAHLGAIGTPGEDPLNLGFDVNIGGHAAGAPESYHGTDNFGNGKEGKEIWAVPGLEKYHGKNVHLSEAITQEALMSLDSVVATQQPFFLYMAHYAVHTPIMPDDRFVQKYFEKGMDSTEAKYASMVEGMDKSLGDIMDYLEEKEIAENTIILFMSDNGGLSSVARGGERHKHNLPLSSGKGSVYEGGIREPMLVKWPGTAAPNTESNEQVIIEDFYPSILEMAGIEGYETVQAVDGKSFVATFEEEMKEPGEPRALFWHYPNEWGPDGPGIGASSAVRKGDWKFIYFHEDRRMELYNLKRDIGETKNLVAEESDKVKELASVLTNHLKDVKAQMPIEKSTGERVPYPSELIIEETGPELSFIAKNLEFKGVALEDKDYTIWGCAPIQSKDGKTHLFAARWPEKNVDPAWRKSSEIAHYVSNSPEGPFTFSDVAITGTNENTWDKYAPHNPEITKVDDKYVLVYIANTDHQQPPHPSNQSIGMAMSDSPYGPWEKVGVDGKILDSNNPEKWNYQSKNGVANPTFLTHNGKFYLYFKTRHINGNLQYGLAVADNLEGPYTITDSPVTSNKGTLEDGTVFKYEDHIYLLTTDNHGENTGVVGGGTLWKSKDGIYFKLEDATIGYGRLPSYYLEYDEKISTKIYGPDPKLERPKILMSEGKPAYLYGPGGWNIYGGDRTVAYVFKINL